MKLSVYAPTQARLSQFSRSPCSRANQRSYCCTMRARHLCQRKSQWVSGHQCRKDGRFMGMANQYYDTNDVYERLQAYGPDVPFVWVSGNAWIVAYADAGEVMRILAFVTGRSTDSANGDELTRLQSARRVAGRLANAANVPFADIWFDDTVDEIDSVRLNGTEINLTGLRRWFAGSGLPVNDSAPAKSINRQASSAYHDWQRAHLGTIKVTDIDLLRMDRTTDRIEAIYELKRSYIGLDQWKPFPDDFTNFNIASGLATAVGARFRIVYNVFHREDRGTGRPRVDDASQVSTFSYSRSEGGTTRLLGTMNFEDFVAGSST